MEKTVEILSGVRLLNPASGFDGVVDVAIDRGRVLSISQSSEEPSGLWLLPGLVDMHVHLRTPGQEDAETLETGLKAAIAGGVTRVGMMPNTTPPLDSFKLVKAVKERGDSLGLARVEPVPCVTVNRAGVVCTELEVFAASGITSFSDDGSPVKSDEALLDAFQRISVFNGVIIEHPEVIAMAVGGVVNLGRASSETGAAGIPESAEFLDVERCIDVLRKSGTGARLHLTHLSSPESVLLVHKAAEEGLQVTCDVTPHHLALNEQAVISLGSVAKMNPPLRSEESRRRIVDMISRGMVTAIASDHAPHTPCRKQMPLASAAFGITGLETLLPVAADVLCREGGMAPLDVVRLLTTGPAGVLNSPLPEVAAGKPLNMILFDPTASWRYSRTFSSSANSPFFGEELTGRILRVWLGRELYRDGEFV